MLRILWPSVCGKAVTCCSFVGRESNDDYQPTTTTTTSLLPTTAHTHTHTHTGCKAYCRPSWTTGGEKGIKVRRFKLAGLMSSSVPVSRFACPRPDLNRFKPRVLHVHGQLFAAVLGTSVFMTSSAVDWALKANYLFFVCLFHCLTSS